MISFISFWSSLKNFFLLFVSVFVIFAVIETGSVYATETASCNNGMCYCGDGRVIPDSGTTSDTAKDKCDSYTEEESKYLTPHEFSPGCSGNACKAPAKMCCDSGYICSDSKCVPGSPGSGGTRGESVSTAFVPVLTNRCQSEAVSQGKRVCDRNNQNCYIISKVMFGSNGGGACLTEKFAVKDPDYNSCGIGYLFTHPRIAESPSFGFIPFELIIAKRGTVPTTVFNLSGVLVGATNNAWLEKDFIGYSLAVGNSVNIARASVNWKTEVDLSGIDTLFITDYFVNKKGDPNNSRVLQNQNDVLTKIATSFNSGMDIVIAGEQGNGLAGIDSSSLTRQILSKLDLGINYESDSTKKETVLVKVATEKFSETQSLPMLNGLAFNIGASNFPSTHPYWGTYQTPGIISWNNSRQNLVCIFAVQNRCLMAYYDGRPEGKGTLLIDTNGGWGVRSMLNKSSFSLSPTQSRFCGGEVACMEVKVQKKTGTTTWDDVALGSDDEEDAISVGSTGVPDLKFTAKANLSNCGVGTTSSSDGKPIGDSGVIKFTITKPGAGGTITGIGVTSSLASGYKEYTYSAVSADLGYGKVKVEAQALCKMDLLGVSPSPVAQGEKLLSLNKKTYSTSDAGPEYSSKFAVDGSVENRTVKIGTKYVPINNYWGSALKTALDPEPVLVVDLGKEYCLSKVEVVGRQYVGKTIATTALEQRNHFSVVGFNEDITKKPTNEWSKYISEKVSSGSKNGYLDLGSFNLKKSSYGYFNTIINGNYKYDSLGYANAINKKFPVSGTVSFPLPKDSASLLALRKEDCEGGKKAVRYVAIKRDLDMQYRLVEGTGTNRLDYKKYTATNTVCPATPAILSGGNIIAPSIEGVLIDLQKHVSSYDYCQYYIRPGYMEIGEVKVYGYEKEETSRVEKNWALTANGGTVKAGSSYTGTGSSNPEFMIDGLSDHPSNGWRSGDGGQQTVMIGLGRTVRLSSIEIVPRNSGITTRYLTPLDKYEVFYSKSKCPNTVPNGNSAYTGGFAEYTPPAPKGINSTFTHDDSIFTSIAIGGTQYIGTVGSMNYEFSSSDPINDVTPIEYKYTQKISFTTTQEYDAQCIYINNFPSVSKIDESNSSSSNHFGASEIRVFGWGDI